MELQDSESVSQSQSTAMVNIPMYLPRHNNHPQKEHCIYQLERERRSPAVAYQRNQSVLSSFSLTMENETATLRVVREEERKKGRGERQSRTYKYYSVQSMP